MRRSPRSAPPTTSSTSSSSCRCSAGSRRPGRCRRRISEAVLGQGALTRRTAEEMIKIKSILRPRLLGGSFAAASRRRSETHGVAPKFQQSLELRRRLRHLRRRTSCSAASRCSGKSAPAATRPTCWRSATWPKTGGPGYSEAQVKALAARIRDRRSRGRGRRAPGHCRPTAGRRRFATSRTPAMPMAARCRRTSRCWPRRAARRQPFPWWILNYFTAYSEGGPDYIHALLTGYDEAPPDGVEVPRRASTTTTTSRATLSAWRRRCSDGLVDL